MNCSKCETEITQQFCPYRGKHATLKHIDGHNIIYEIVHLLQFENGFPYPIFAMATKPGKTVETFLYEDRKKLVKSILFLTLIYVSFTLGQFFNPVRFSSCLNAFLAFLFGILTFSFLLIVFGKIADHYLTNQHH